MNRVLVLLALLVGAAFQFVVAPSLRPKPSATAVIRIDHYVAPPASFHSLVHAMHGNAVAAPRLFTRFYGFWLTYMTRAQACDVELAKPIERLMVRYVLTLRSENARQAYFDMGHIRNMSDQDWEDMRIACELRGCSLVKVPWAQMREDVGGYSPTSNQISLPENALAPGYATPRVIAIHEFTHLVQCNLLAAGFIEPGAVFQFTGSHSVEIAAMIVETAEMIHDGLTRSEAEALDLWPDPDNGATAWEPRMSGGLVWDYVRRYGPHLTGDFAQDLLIVERWVKNAEVVSRRSARVDFIEPARRAIELHETTDLAACFQTFLGINGEPSWFPIHAEDLLEGPAYVTESANILANVPQERRAAVEDFLIRIDGP